MDTDTHSPIDLASLRRAIEECSERKLYFSAKWLSELYASAPRSNVDKSRSTINHLGMSVETYPLPGVEFHNSTPLRPIASQRQPPQEDPDVLEETSDSALIRVAQSNFDNHQLHRNVHLLRNAKSPKALFLRYYCQFLTGEKKSLAIWNNLDGVRERQAHHVNMELGTILEEMGEVKDPYLLFLKGVVSARSKRRLQAQQSLIASLKLQPWNWSAWLQLGQTLETQQEIDFIIPQLPAHVMTRIFRLRLMVEMHLPGEGHDELMDSLLLLFPDSLYLLSQKAQICFQEKDWTAAEQIWDHIHQTDPNRVDDIDQFSNMLFIMKKREKLFRLAHEYLDADQTRPEILSLIGNYYSMLDEHDKAIEYLRRAVLLDCGYRSGWTLIGHEYVYIKNYPAAIEAYRRSIELNKRDYRAWLGLGRAYENLSMPTYALNYFSRALALYSYDQGLWQSLGNVYMVLNKHQQALVCLKQALEGISMDNPTELDRAMYMKIIAIYDALPDEYEQEAMDSHRVLIQISRKLGKPLSEYSESCLKIAKYYTSLATQSFKPVVGLQSNYHVDADAAAPNILLAKQYLQMLINDGLLKGAIGASAGAGGATGGGGGGGGHPEAVNTAKEMLRQLETVKLSRARSSPR